MSQNKPEISVILPTYNRCDRLEKCLPSFLLSSVKNAEFIIVDNSSTDRTWSYLNEVSKSDSRLRLIKNPQNLGGIKTIFRAYCEVRSPFAIFLADDDRMIGDYIARCLDIFTNHPDVGIIHHFFGGWENSPDRDKNPYQIYPNGSEAMKRVFMLSGAFPGIAVRMSDFPLRDFALGENVIYPQVKFSLEIASKKALAIINDCGLVAEDFGDSIIDVNLSQNRPDDMGIGERLSYACNKKTPLLTQEFAFQISMWAENLLDLFDKKDTAHSKKFVKSLAISLNTITPVFILLLLKKRKLKHALVSLIRLTLNPSFIKNYGYFLIFAARNQTKT